MITGPSVPGLGPIRFQGAIETGYTEPKNFPAEAAGGANYLKSVSSPIPAARTVVESCRNMIARWPNTHTYALARPGSGVEGLLAAADPPTIPTWSPWALLANGYARRDADPCAAYHVRCRGPRIAQDSANRQSESNLAVSLSRLAATHGDPMCAVDYLMQAIRNHYHVRRTHRVSNFVSPSQF